MNRNSNTYTIVYAAVMVILVSAALAVAAISLKEPQEKNKEVEKKMNILLAVEKAQDVATVSDKNAYVEDEFKKYIVEQFLVDAAGNKVEGDAFNVDLKAALEKPAADRKLPVFVYRYGTEIKYIFPVRGAGLWGPIWGYVALEDDFNTISGATFDHKGETPGLGAEIATTAFQRQFDGKKIYQDDRFSSIQVVKPGVPLDDHSVDGISGGTITSKALETMIHACLANYEPFFKKNKKMEVIEVEGDLTVVPWDSAATTKVQIQ